MVDNITTAMVNNTSVTKLDMCNCAITDECMEVSFITSDLCVYYSTINLINLDNSKTVTVVSVACQGVDLLL